jgi:hypothetical protein
VGFSLERTLQWLDDLDDLLGTVGLLAERMRRLAVTLARLLVLLAVAAWGVVAALTEPPLGLESERLPGIFVSHFWVPMQMRTGRSEAAQRQSR